MAEFLSTRINMNQALFNVTFKPAYTVYVVAKYTAAVWKKNVFLNLASSKLAFKFREMIKIAFEMPTKVFFELFFFR